MAFKNFNAQPSEDNEALAAYIDYAAQELGLPPNSETVIKHAKLLREHSDLRDRYAQLQVDLENAETDPLTGYLWKGPGFRELEELISVVENVQDGLISGTEMPNAIFALGYDVEALHYTNNWYGHAGGDVRLVEAGRDMRSAAEIIRDCVRTSDRRRQARPDSAPRLKDVLIRTGGDEFMAACAVHLTSEHDEEDIANTIIDRMKVLKNQNIPASRVIFLGKFWQRGQTPEDLYNSVDPKGQMARMQKLARPVIKIARFGLGQYKPSRAVISEL